MRDNDAHRHIDKLYTVAGEHADTMTDIIKGLADVTEKHNGFVNKIMNGEAAAEPTTIKIDFKGNTRIQSMLWALEFLGPGTDDPREIVQAAEHFRAYLEGRTKFAWVPPEKGEENGSIEPSDEYTNVTEWNEYGEVKEEVDLADTQPVERPEP